MIARKPSFYPNFFGGENKIREGASKRLENAIPIHQFTLPMTQRMFQVFVKGGIGSIESPNWQYIPLVYQVYIAF